MVSMSDRLVDALISDFPDYEKNTRPIHAVGIGATGWFRGSDAAAGYCAAEHFGRSWTPTTIRFSNGNGSPVERDLDRQARGMAVKFHLGQVTTDEHGVMHGEAETDLIAMSLPMFFVKTPEKALDFCTAFLPRPVVRPSWWQQLRALITLCPFPPQDPGVTMSGDAGILAFAEHYPPAQPGVVAMGMMKPPVSYLRCGYHAVHAFDVDDAQGTHRLVRFSWEPVAGTLSEARSGLADNYLHTELAAQLEEGPARFILRMQISDPWDDTTDPTTVWTTNRRRVFMGTLVVAKLVADQEAGCERLSFNPARLVPGIAISDDPILRARLGAYEASCRRRGGSGCPAGDVIDLRTDSAGEELERTHLGDRA